MCAVCMVTCNCRLAEVPGPCCIPRNPIPAFRDTDAICVLPHIMTQASSSNPAINTRSNLDLVNCNCIQCAARICWVEHHMNRVTGDGIGTEDLTDHRTRPNKHAQQASQLIQSGRKPPTLASNKKIMYCNNLHAHGRAGRVCRTGNH